MFFPVHLRTRKVIEEHKLEIGDNIILSDPLGYKEFMGVLANSKFVMTDSGGIQEESVVLNIPCLVLRDNTEWMCYIDTGKNLLLGTSYQNIVDTVWDLLENEQKLVRMKQIQAPIKHDVSESIVSILNKNLK